MRPTRERLLNAAHETLREHGMGRLTLDAVARQAGISKGGLLHHFPSKSALIEALIHQISEAFAARVEALAATMLGDANALLRAYVSATFEEDSTPMEMLTLLLSVTVDDPRLFQQLQQDFAHWRQKLAQTRLSAPRAHLIQMAADQFWTEQFFCTYSAIERAALRDELFGLIDLWTEDATR